MFSVYRYAMNALLGNIIIGAYTANRLSQLGTSKEAKELRALRVEQSGGKLELDDRGDVVATRREVFHSEYLHLPPVQPKPAPSSFVALCAFIALVLGIIALSLL